MGVLPVSVGLIPVFQWGRNPQLHQVSCPVSVYALRGDGVPVLIGEYRLPSGGPHRHPLPDQLDGVSSEKRIKRLDVLPRLSTRLLHRDSLGVSPQVFLELLVSVAVPVVDLFESHPSLKHGYEHGSVALVAAQDHVSYLTDCEGALYRGLAASNCECGVFR